MIEKWITIEEFPNYKISNLGNVRNINTGKAVATPIHQHGYHCVRLWNKGKTRLMKIYRLIAIHFIPNPDSKREVNHINGNRMDHSIKNLEWVTPSENMKHAFRCGLSKCQFKKGFKHQLAKLTPHSVGFIIKSRSSKTHSLKELSKMFGVTPDHICRVANQKIKYV